MGFRTVYSGFKAEDVEGLVFRVYLDPKEPIFLGFLIMISKTESLKR